MKNLSFDLKPPFESFPEIDLSVGNIPFIVAGPCSVESEEQVLQTARELKKIPQVKIFRSGIWKPRTRPNSFEGIGSVGLKWLNIVQSECNFPVAIEVASPRHVEEALKHNMDMVWLGARTVVNPFLVQEIAESLKGYDIPVFVKNPINTDLSLWIGALERLNYVGIKKLVAVHRGFSTLEKSDYRYPPVWKIPFDLKRTIPNLPILCDPSHICGNRRLIGEVSQMALDLDFSGLMIETHINPTKALSDAEQQLTPNELATLLENLHLKKSCLLPQFEDKMAELRKKIDKVDFQMIDLLYQRKKIVEELSLAKKENNMTILQIERLKQMVSERISKGKELDLSGKYIEEFFSLIHEESVKQQQLH